MASVFIGQKRNGGHYFSSYYDLFTPFSSTIGARFMTVIIFLFEDSVGIAAS
jgi:hypothetical protein